MLEVTRDDVQLLETLLLTLKEHEDVIGEEDPTALSVTMTDTHDLIRRMRKALPALPEVTPTATDDDDSDIPL